MAGKARGRRRSRASPAFVPPGPSPGAGRPRGGPWRRGGVVDPPRATAASPRSASGTIGGRDGQAYFRALLAREEAEGIDPAVVEAAAGGAGRDHAPRRGPAPRKGHFAARREQDSSRASRIDAVTTKVVEFNGTHAPSPAQGHALWWPHQGDAQCGDRHCPRGHRPLKGLRRRAIG